MRGALHGAGVRGLVLMRAATIVIRAHLTEDEVRRVLAMDTGWSHLQLGAVLLDEVRLEGPGATFTLERPTPPRPRYCPTCGSSVCTGQDGGPSGASACTGS